MNTNEINQAIAEKRGEIKEISTCAHCGLSLLGLGVQCCHEYDGTVNYRADIKCRDYTNNQALILELQMELLDKGWKLWKCNNEYYWVSRGNDPLDIIVNSNFGIATALAWLEEFNNE
jgi:hypothetical protein